MKPFSIKPQSQPSVPPVVKEPEIPKITIDMAEQIADRAARRAAEETVSKNLELSRENMVNQNRIEESRKEESDSIYEEPAGGYSIDTRTEKNLMRRLLDQTLQKALDPPPPSPIENAVNQVMNTVSAGIAEKMLGNIGGGTPQVMQKSSILNDILNSQFGAGLGQNLGANLPQLVQSLTGAIGQQKAQELATAATRAMSQQGGNVDVPTENSNSNLEKQKDMVLALDSNNPEHIKQYASAMGLTERAAKGMLQIHQEDIINERKIFGKHGGNDSEVTQALTVLIHEMTGMKETINNLQNKIVTLESGKVTKAPDGVEVDTDSRWGDDTQQQINVSTVPVNRNVTLFQTPIKVDVDDIKGNSDPFFNDAPKPNVNTNIVENSINKAKKQDESVLEEVVDSDGNSSFRMSGESAVKQKNEVENKKEIENIVENKPEVVVESKEEPKKEISNEQPAYKKRVILKKPVPMAKKEQERYDINNNLINGE